MTAADGWKVSRIGFPHVFAGTDFEKGGFSWSQGRQGVRNRAAAVMTETFCEGKMCPLTNTWTSLCTTPGPVLTEQSPLHWRLGEK